MFDFVLQAIQFLLPKQVKELSKTLKALRANTIESPGAITPLGEEPRISEDTQVLRNSGACHLKVTCDFTGGELPSANQPENGNPVRFRQGLKCNLSLLLRHHRILVNTYVSVNLLFPSPTRSLELDTRLDTVVGGQLVAACGSVHWPRCLLSCRGASHMTTAIVTVQLDPDAASKRLWMTSEVDLLPRSPGNGESPATCSQPDRAFRTFEHSRRGGWLRSPCCAVAGRA